MSLGHHKAHILLLFINKVLLFGAVKILIELESLDTKEYR